MKKIIFIGIFLVFSLVIISCNLHEKNLKIDDDNILGIYLNNELQTSIPKKGEAVFSKAVCDSDKVNYYWDIDNWGLYVNSFSNKMKCNLYFVNYSGQTTFDFDYTGGEQTFTAPVSGTYRLETWGAQGGSHTVEKHGGYGGYSIGTINLKISDNIFINVGGQGIVNNSNVGEITSGGYNGGGNTAASASEYLNYGSSGGGATHIANKSGLLSSLENYRNNILIVSGGGGGSNYDTKSYLANGIGGAGGGFVGNNGTSPVYNDQLINVFATGGTQTSYGITVNSSNVYSTGKNGAFGLGGDSANNSGAGGSGYFGGGGGAMSSDDSSGAGGSGYIGNSLLTNKVMYCYNCKESNEENTKTISTTCSEETPTSNCSKKGNGYARITLVSINS